MRLRSDNGGIQQNQPLLPHSHNPQDVQNQPQIRSAYTGSSGISASQEFNGNFTSIDTEVVR